MIKLLDFKRKKKTDCQWFRNLGEQKNARMLMSTRAKMVTNKFAPCFPFLFNAACPPTFGGTERDP